MKVKVIVALVVAVVMCFFAQTVLADYDGVMVKAAMKQAAQCMKGLKEKSAAKDYYGTAEAFMEMARIFKGLDIVTPTKAEKAKWDQIHGNIINTAFKGIGACGARDDAAIKQAMQDLGKYTGEGHKLFR